jgi:hypothetical protein
VEEGRKGVEEKVFWRIFVLYGCIISSLVVVVGELVWKRTLVGF